jgi:hypothetical protein
VSQLRVDVVLAAAQVDRLLTTWQGTETTCIGVKQDDPVNSTDTENATTTAFRFLIVAHPPFVLTLRDNDPLGFVEKKKDT